MLYRCLFFIRTHKEGPQVIRFANSLNHTRQGASQAQTCGDVATQQGQATTWSKTRSVTSTGHDRSHTRATQKATSWSKTRSGKARGTIAHSSAQQQQASTQINAQLSSDNRPSNHPIKQQAPILNNPQATNQPQATMQIDAQFSRTTNNHIPGCPSSWLQAANTN